MLLFGQTFVLQCLLLHVPLAAGFLDVPDGPVTGPPLRVGSFNIKQFGQNKMSKPNVVDVLVKILSRYDVVQVLEIQDINQTAFEKLRLRLNDYMRRNDYYAHFQKEESERLGRTKSKEQYGFLYRPSRVTVMNTSQFVDEAGVFERAPFGVQFASPTTVVDFAMVAVHIKPQKDLTVAELGKLTNVYDAFQREWNMKNIIIGGDFNAACRYLSAGDLNRLPLRTDRRFTWLINDTMDTSVSTKLCAYNRFVMSGTALPAAVVPGSVKVYYFDSIMHLDYTQAMSVSDHYPIEFELRGRQIND